MRVRLDNKAKRAVETATREVDLTFDSGAFSAWRRKEVLPVKGYIKFLKRFEGINNGYVNLDVIPGTPGFKPTTLEVDEAAAASWKNLEAMHKAGLKPMPVYHMGERRYWLEKMLGEGHKHIGLGGFARARDEVRKEFLDQVFSFLCGSKGYPSVYIHGFGMTSAPLIFRYPWFSVDSISWRLMAAYGWVLIPKMAEDGGWDYNRAPLQICVSWGSKGKDNGVHKGALGNDRHIESVGKRTREWVVRWLTEQNIDLKKCRFCDVERTRACLRFYLACEKNYRPRPFFWRRQGLFCGSTEHGQTTPIAPFRILFTTNLTKVQSDLLQDEGIRERLLSYYFFKDFDPFDIPEYIRTGRIGKVRKLSKKVTV